MAGTETLLQPSSSVLSVGVVLTFIQLHDCLISIRLTASVALMAPIIFSYIAGEDLIPI